MVLTLFALIAGLTYIGFNAAQLDCDTLFSVAFFIHWLLTNEGVTLFVTLFSPNLHGHWGPLWTFLAVLSHHVLALAIASADHKFAKPKCSPAPHLGELLFGLFAMVWCCLQAKWMAIQRHFVPISMVLSQELLGYLQDLQCSNGQSIFKKLQNTLTERISFRTTLFIAPLILLRSGSAQSHGSVCIC